MICKRLEGQVAIVTGAAQGLGEALARRLDKEGCKVVVADINFEGAQKVASELSEAIAVKCDVTNEEDVETMVDKTIELLASLI